jgi:hypothetical protein
LTCTISRVTLRRTTTWKNRTVRHLKQPRVVQERHVDAADVVGVGVDHAVATLRRQAMQRIGE